MSPSITRMGAPASVTDRVRASVRVSVNVRVSGPVIGRLRDSGRTLQEPAR